MPANVQALSFENGHLEGMPAIMQEFFPITTEIGESEKNTCKLAGILSILLRKQKKHVISPVF